VGGFDGETGSFGGCVTGLWSQREDEGATGPGEPLLFEHGPELGYECFVES